MHFLWVFGQPVSLQDLCVIQTVFLSLAFSPLQVLSPKVNAWSVDHFIFNYQSNFVLCELLQLFLLAGMQCRVEIDSK